MLTMVNRTVCYDAVRNNAAVVADEGFWGMCWPVWGGAGLGAGLEGRIGQGME